jgi:hypothetical protein
MLLKVLCLVVVALAVGLPVTAVATMGQKKLLAEVDRFTNKVVSGGFDSTDQTTSTSTYMSWYQVQFEDGTDRGQMTFFVYSDQEYFEYSCQISPPVTYQGVFSIAQFGNCSTTSASDNPPASPLRGCTQFLVRLKGQPKEQDKCSSQQHFDYYDIATDETVFISQDDKYRSVPASGTVEGVGCALSSPVLHPVSGRIYQNVRVMRIKRG